MIKMSRFPGLKEASDDFVPFKLLEAFEDPYFPGVFMLHIKFTEDPDKHPDDVLHVKEDAHGLCIYDVNRKRFIEEPGDLADYDTTPEECKKKYKFKNWR